jgi:hypothetical protein
MKKLQKLITYYKNVDPCSEESTCLVRPACYMLQSTPWVRWQKCPDYKRYCDRRDKFTQIKSKMSDWFWVVIILGVFFIVVIVFGLGVWKLIELIQILVALK